MRKKINGKERERERERGDQVKRVINCENEKNKS